MVNCGFAVRFYMTRKEYLNLLVKRFPPSPNVSLDIKVMRDVFINIRSIYLSISSSNWIML